MSNEKNVTLTKTIDQYFCDWENEAFGFGYGTGEPVIIPKLKMFLDACGIGNKHYDFRVLEEKLGAESTWFLINILCREGIIEYGSSPRFGWLTDEGLRLKEYMTSRTDDELTAVLFTSEEWHEKTICYKNACNCGPEGYVEGKQCSNPFWPNRVIGEIIGLGEVTEEPKNHLRISE